MFYVMTVNYPKQWRPKYEKYIQLLAEHQIVIDPTNNMCEALEKLNKKKYAAIYINADNYSYLPYLQKMRDSTSAYIAVITKKYNYKEKIAALIGGADAYTFRHDTEEERSVWAYALIRRLARIDTSDGSSIIEYGDVTMDNNNRKVFVNGNEVKLTRKEYDILYYLIVNAGRVLSYGQIYRYVWGEEYAHTINNVLWNHMNRLRRKLKAYGVHDFILNSREVGYYIDTLTEN